MVSATALAEERQGLEQLVVVAGLSGAHWLKKDQIQTLFVCNMAEI